MKVKDIILEEDKRKDKYCSDDCCGSNVKAEDCKCSPTCKSCNCNAVTEEKQKGVDGKVCWDGYKRMGTKKKGGKTVDNCVKMEEDNCSMEETYDDDDDFYEAYGIMEETLEEAEYQGRKVKLNKPMQGDVKKFKVYVKDPKTGNVKKVNFGHGGSSVKGKAMRIRKNNPKARKSFRARHNCDNPGPKTKARYWSCRKW